MRYSQYGKGFQNGKTSCYDQIANGFAKMALKTAQEILQLYSDLRSRHDFTQAQIFTILALRQFFKTDYRKLKVSTCPALMVVRGSIF